MRGGWRESNALDISVDKTVTDWRLSLLPQRILDLFTLSTSPYNTRYADFILPRFSTVTFGKQSLRYTGPKLWNKLSSEARNIPSLKQFKLFIRKADLSNILDTDLCKNCNTDMHLVVMYSFKF